MALLALNHTPVEHQLYETLLQESNRVGTRAMAINTKQLLKYSGVSGLSTLRRGLAGLLSKMSLEKVVVANGDQSKRRDSVYVIFTPEEIFSRRRQANLPPYPQEVQPLMHNPAFGVAMERALSRYSLSRREAQVALCCASGMSNLEIGEKLFISEQTVKFHLRRVFLKCNVRRRAELISRLLISSAGAGGLL